MRRIPVKPVPSVADLGCDILFQREAVSGYRRYETRLNSIVDSLAGFLSQEWNFRNACKRISPLEIHTISSPILLKKLKARKIIRNRYKILEKRTCNFLKRNQLFEDPIINALIYVEYPNI